MVRCWARATLGRWPQADGERTFLCGDETWGTQEEIYLWANRQTLGGGVEVGMRSCLWEAGKMCLNFGVRATCKATGLNAADLHPIDFPEQTIFASLIFAAY